MGAKNLVMLKTYVDSINICFMNEFVYGNMLWAFASLRVFVCNYVLYSFGLILGYVFRFEVGDRESKLHVPPPLADQTERDQLQYSEFHGFTKELANLLFWSSEDVHEAGEEREGETESSAFMEIVSDDPEDSKSREGKTENSVLMETNTAIPEDTKKREGETDCSALKETDSGIHENGKNREADTEGSVTLKTDSDAHVENEADSSVFMETDSYVHEDVKKIDEHETESSVFMEGDSNDHQDGRKGEEEEETDFRAFVESESATTRSDCQYLSGKDISVFMDEDEPTTKTFTFRENSSAIFYNAFANTGNIADKEFSEISSKEGLVAQEQEESVQEQRTFPSHFTCDRFRFESDGFGGSDSSDDERFLSNDNSLPSDSESESSSSSGLIWANSNNIDDSMAYQVLASYNSCEGFESENLNEFKEERVQDVEEGSDHEEEARRDSLEKAEETRWEEKLAESDSDEQDDDDFEWEHDDLVEQLRLELRNARQGGLATILEEEEYDDGETESPKVVEDLKPLKIEKKLEYKDQIDEIQKVYKNYTDKMRKLDILNYQTMHAIGLLQLRDPLKSISTLKSTVPGAKPLNSQNLWPRKAPKNTSDPLLKFFHELHRDLELVYVGQACLSWEILCWQHRKAQELKQYDSQWSRRYNLAAGEFQLFQVLMQRFIENEPFQGPRIQNYVKNRCVIRNLLHVPAIKDDSMKDKSIIKGGEDDAIASGKLAEIIKESMRVFWEFVRADKDYGNVILKGSHQIGADLKDPAISDLLVDVRTQLKKKERKLKDIVRSGNCIVRKFQKHHEDQMDHEQLLAQVGLRLISRVVNMSKLRKDQLIWCNENLNRIKFVSRKIQVEPSFLLFPC